MKEILVKRELIREWDIKTVLSENNQEVLISHLVLQQKVEKYIKPWWVVED